MAHPHDDKITIGRYSEFNPNYVFLELNRRASGDTEGGDIITNRIGLLVSTMDISTNKQNIAFPIPFSGIITGESRTVGIDMGVAQKQINLTGTIVDQIINKNSGQGSVSEVQSTGVKMSAYEIAQLLHSYVDSSSFHEDQNMSKLIILIPSRVDENFNQRPDGDTKDLTSLPLIPFTWSTRDYDNPYPSLATNFPKAIGGNLFDGEGNLIAKEQEMPGVTGYIDTFSCGFTGTEVPQVTFQMTFTNATTVASDFINRAT